MQFGDAVMRREVTDAEIVAAVQEGTLDEAVLDQRCEEFLNIILQYEENRDKDAVFQYERDHEIARQIEEECIVLLKNEGRNPSFVSG